MTEAEIGLIVYIISQKAKDCWQLPEARKDKERFSPAGFKRKQSPTDNTLILDASP